MRVPKSSLGPDLASLPMLPAATGLFVGGSAALFSVLGGASLLARGAATTPASWPALGGAVMAAMLLVVNLWGFWTLRRVVARLLATGQDAAAYAQRRLQLLPYCVAAGDLLSGLTGGTLAAARLVGLQPEDRVLAALLWGGCCGVLALAVLLHLRAVMARRVVELDRDRRLPAPVGRLLPLRSKLLGGFGWLLMCVTGLSVVKHILAAEAEGRPVGIPTRGVLVALLAQVVAVGGVVALAIVALAWPVRDLLGRALAVVGESRGSRGEVQRPIVLGVPATAELHELQGLFEQLRRRLLSRLRSSTEQNLRLEAEVARRSAELSRRNEQLTDALARLHSAREALLSAEKLATVGRIAAGITSEVDVPVATMGASCTSLSAVASELLSGAPQQVDSTGTDRQEALVGACLGRLQELNTAALRVRDLVRAMRVYVRPSETQAMTCDVVAVLLDVRQLFGEPFQRVMTVQTPGAGPGRGCQIVTVRSDLALLLASWLARVQARLPADQPPRVIATPRIVDRTGSGARVCELTLWDNGQPLSAAELAEPPGGELLRRLGAEVALRSAASETAVGYETLLTLTLPLAPAADAVG